MAQFVFPALHGLLIWWFSTALILFLDGLPPRTFRWSMTGATVVLLAALYGLAAGANDTSVLGAYIAFTCGVLVWAWLEVSFYTGYLTGPRRHHCTHGCRGWRHFMHALQASLYHEIAVLVLAGTVVALTWNHSNLFGMWTFVVLWWMHQSARLNVFLGVSNLNAEFLPQHLDHLRCFFACRPMNLLFPFSVTLSTLGALLLAQQALARAGDAFHATGLTLLTMLMVLAILEHWFLVLPISAARIWNAMWQWSLGARSARAQPVRAAPESITSEVTIGGRP
jgi:putative photosynthetic complex assembly protein 2